MTPYYIGDLRSYYLPPPMIEVEQEIVEYCDYFTVDATREDLRYIDCVYYNMGLYGNSPEQMKEMRRRYGHEIRPIFN